MMKTRVRPFRSILVTAAAVVLAAATLGACDNDADNSNANNNQNNDGGTLLLTDAQVVGVAATANQGEIDAANAYLPRAQNQQSAEFARQMITEHTATLQRQQALAASLGLAPAPSTTQQQLQAMNAQTLQQLQATQPPQLDLAYMQSQVVAHQEVLRIVDQQLLPSATIPALREDLARTRADVARHLQEAQAIVSNLTQVGTR